MLLKETYVSFIIENKEDEKHEEEKTLYYIVLDRGCGCLWMKIQSENPQAKTYFSTVFHRL